MQGWRINMEDSHTHILSLPDDPGTAFFGVFDGHGGAKVADYAGKHLHKYIIKRNEFRYVCFEFLFLVLSAYILLNFHF